MKNPYDMSQMFRMFDPEDVQKFFDPNQMFSAFAPAKTNAFDMSGVFDMNRKNFEAMVDANKAAAAAYKDLLEKQMEVFGQLTQAAREHVAWVDETTGPEAVSNRTESYALAVEKALVLMRKLADAARDANEEAYTQIKGQVNDALEDIKQKTK
ncbi:phasin family protein [Meridianimarinicoccus sp. RP-17]|uniref:phasin family protein n=1 Tax=Meridianimarinicoccus zhengii TaxID=2056810 RepID=UPI000DABB205|nr:phasin family protein [Phycocomes zhengii]